jgi:hypothetical protein
MAAKAKPARRVERLEWRPIDQLVGHPQNSRTHSPEQIEELRRSLRTFGWTRPIIVADDVKGLPSGTIIVGHGFWEAARAEGYTEAKVIVAEHYSADELRAYMLADNGLALQSGWDEEKVKAELEHFAALGGGFDMRALGFSAEELDRRMKAFANGGHDPNQGVAGSLSAKFGVPPFTVLNAREGWWQDRKAAWIALGIKSEVGRGQGVQGGASPGGSPRPLDRKKGAKQSNAPKGGGGLYLGKTADGKTDAAVKYGKPRRANATPGGSPMPAMSYKNKQRGDGRGRPMS